MPQPRPRLTLLPTTLSDVLHVGERGAGYCAQCQAETTYIGRQITITLPPVPFILGGIAGVCTDCDALVAMPPVLFNALVSAWEHRGSDAARFVCTVRRPGEPPIEYRARLVAVAEVSSGLAAELECEPLVGATTHPRAEASSDGEAPAPSGAVALVPDADDAPAPLLLLQSELASDLLAHLPPTGEPMATKAVSFGVLGLSVQ